MRSEKHFRPYFHYCLSSVHYYEDCFEIRFLSRGSQVRFSYIYIKNKNIIVFILLRICIEVYKALYMLMSFSILSHFIDYLKNHFATKIANEQSYKSDGKVEDDFWLS